MNGFEAGAGAAGIARPDHLATVGRDRREACEAFVEGDALGRRDAVHVAQVDLPVALRLGAHEEEVLAAKAADEGKGGPQ